MKGSSFYGHGNQSPAKKALVGNQGNLPDHLKAKIDAAPGKMYDSPAKQKETDQEELTRLVNKRTKLKDNEAKRNAKRSEGKKVFLGNIKTKINKKKEEKVQTKINENNKAQENLKNATKPGPEGPPPIEKKELRDQSVFDKIKKYGTKKRGELKRTKRK